MSFTLLAVIMLIKKSRISLQRRSVTGNKLMKWGVFMRNVIKGKLMKYKVL